MSHYHMKPSRFPDTHWSLVRRAGASDELTRQQGLTELLVDYTPALRAFLVTARGLSSELADDLLQDFVLDKVLARKLVQRADQSKGKFRNYLLKSLNNFANTKLNREYRDRAKVIGLDGAGIAGLKIPQIVDSFDQEWVQQAVQDALRLMEDDCRNRNRTDLWELFRLRVVDPMLYDMEPISYDQIVKQFNLRSPRQAINLLVTAKRSFFRHLRSAVGRYVSENKIDEEISDLRAIVER